jgi:hypothetical protein
MLGTEGVRSAADKPEHRLGQATGTAPGRSSFTKAMRPTSCTMVIASQRVSIWSIASIRRSMHDEGSGSRYRAVTRVVVPQWHCPGLLEHSYRTKNVTAKTKVDPRAISVDDATSI